MQEKEKGGRMEGGPGCTSCRTLALGERRRGVPGAEGLPWRQDFFRLKPGVAGHPGSGPGYRTVRHLPSTVPCVKTS